MKDNAVGSGASNIYQNTYGTDGDFHSGYDSSHIRRKQNGAAEGAHRAEAQTSTIDRNARNVDGRFELHDSGYFCERGTGRNSHYRQYVSTTPRKDAERLFSDLGRGGETQPLDSGKGLKTTLDDSTRIVYREETKTPNSPAVSIGRSASPKVKNQKIHFVEKSE